MYLKVSLLILSVIYITNQLSIGQKAEVIKRGSLFFINGKSFTIQQIGGYLVQQPCREIKYTEEFIYKEKCLAIKIDNKMCGGRCNSEYNLKGSVCRACGPTKFAKEVHKIYCQRKHQKLHNKVFNVSLEVVKQCGCSEYSCFFDI